MPTASHFFPLIVPTHILADSRRRSDPPAKKADGQGSISWEKFWENMEKKENL